MPAEARPRDGEQSRSGAQTGAGANTEEAGGRGQPRQMPGEGNRGKSLQVPVRSGN